MTNEKVVEPTTIALWNPISKEITGIQLHWEIMNRLYFQPQGKGWDALKSEAPLLITIIQTALIESLLIRISRLMDPECTGKKENLSLTRFLLRATEIDIKKSEKAMREIWDSSGLKEVRNKYLSHNDLSHSIKMNQALNIPLLSADVEALRRLTEHLRMFRSDVNLKLKGTQYDDQYLDIKIQREIEMFQKSLLGGELLFKLLPDNLFLQQAWELEEANYKTQIAQTNFK